MNNLQENFKKAIDLIKSKNKIAIICHINPDADTIGSGLALFYAIKKLNKQADIFCDGDLDNKLSELSGLEHINNPSLSDYSLAIAVDSSDIQRLGKYGMFFKNKNISTLAIDHHLSHTVFTDVAYVDALAAATAEIMYSIIYTLDNTIIDDRIAQLLYMAIVTDSGCFSYNSVRENTHLVASKLIKYDINASVKVYNIFKKISFNVFKMHIEALNNAIFYENNKVAITTVTQDMLKSYSLGEGATEGLTNKVLDIDSVLISIVILEVANNSYKVSIRSKSPAKAVAVGEFFGGGGHILAAGCRINGNVYDVRDKLLRACLLALESVNRL